MHFLLASERLKSGELMEIVCVTPPDDNYQTQIMPFLGHKPPNYFAHIEASFAGNCDSLETRYYIGLIEGTMVGNIMTVEKQGFGIFGHVNTREDQRRKGICQAIIRHQMEDFRRRGGKVLLLGTGFESPPFWIYHSEGFRQMEQGVPGFMRYLKEDASAIEADWFAPSPMRPFPAGWGHWPLVAFLASLPAPAYLRSLTLNVWGPSLLEGPYCKFLHLRGNNPKASAYVLEGESGAVFGVATRIPDSLWHNKIHQLDIFAHPSLTVSEWVTLLDALPPLETKTVCYTDPRDSVKIAALEQTGFQRETVLTEHFPEGEVLRDVWLYAKR